MPKDSAQNSSSTTERAVRINRRREQMAVITEGP